MENENLISIPHFCLYHQVDRSFVESLHHYGLIEITVIEETHYLDKMQLKDIETMVRLHDELDINVEGIDAIYNLLKQITALQKQLIKVENKLKFYEHTNT